MSEVVRPVARPRKFTCGNCGGVFRVGPDWTDDDARRELDERFPEVPDVPAVQVCDHCYDAFNAWHARLTPAERERLAQEALADAALKK